MASGQLFNIQRYCLHDGRGLRTTVFFKGCPLRCAWCHNPESQSSAGERVYRSERCIGCGRCLRACNHDALALREGGPVMVRRERCVHEGACADACPTGATELLGRTWQAEEVLAVLRRDVAFYDESGGGVTFSGGEPLYQPDFLYALLQGCRLAGLRTALDTCGYAEAAVVAQVAPLCDEVLFDVKLMDATAHLAWTGGGNRNVLANLVRVRAVTAERGALLTVRVPLVEGVNDDEWEAERLALFLSALDPVPPVDVLPYQPLGSSKYERLGRTPPSLCAPTAAVQDTWVEILRQAGIYVTVRGELHEHV